MMGYFMEKEIMKKLLMILLSAMLVLSMVGMVSAAEVYIENLDPTSNSHSVEVQVTVGLEQSFTVTIPDSINLNDDLNPGTYTAYDTLSATVHLLNPNTKLVVTIESENVDHQSGQDNYWKLKSGDKSVDYIIASTTGEGDHINENANANWVYEGTEVISLKGPASVTKHLHFKIKDGQFSTITTGEYSDTLIFKVALLPTTST